MEMVLCSLWAGFVMFVTGFTGFLFILWGIKEVIKHRVNSVFIITFVGGISILITFWGLVASIVFGKGIIGMFSIIPMVIAAIITEISYRLHRS